MRTFIVAATSSDGFIANKSHVNSFDWTSKADKDSFKNLTKDAGVVIVGSKTFETFARTGEAPRPLKGRLNIIYSRSKKYKGENVETTDKNPKELVKDLTIRGFQKAAIIGGAEIYRMFIEADEVDTIYLTVEPIKFKTGIPFFNGNLKEKFQLKNTYKNDKTEFRTYERKS
jgi:dihydrofolate reductase